jgi:hypothetical protein
MKRARFIEHPRVPDASHRNEKPFALAIPHGPVAGLKSLQNYFVARFKAGRQTVCASGVVDAGSFAGVNSYVVAAHAVAI